MNQLWKERHGPVSMIPRMLFRYFVVLAVASYCELSYSQTTNDSHHAQAHVTTSSPSTLPASAPSATSWPARLLNYLLDNVPRHVMSFFVGIVCAALFLRPARRLWLRHRLRSASYRSSPEYLADLTYTIANRSETTNHTRCFDVVSQVRRLASSGHHVFLLTGRFGIGKSFLARHLAAELAKPASRWRACISLYLDCSDLLAHDLHSAINDHLAATRQDYRDLLASDRAALFFDGLDQLPYSQTHAGPLHTVLTFARTHFLDRATRNVLFLVVREEFLEVSPELNDYCRRYDLPRLMVRGLQTRTQLRDFLDATHTFSASLWDWLTKTLDDAPDLLPMLGTPLILRHLSSADSVLLPRAPGPGITLAGLYGAGFGHALDANLLKQLEALAYTMYSQDTYRLHVGNDLQAALGHSCVATRAALTAAGLTISSSSIASFVHPSFRDYYAACYIVRRIDAGRVASILGDRVISYLVAEFVAGLLKPEHVPRLYSILVKSRKSTTRGNLLDILVELPDGRLKSAARCLIGELVSKTRFSPPLDPFRLYLAAVAGGFGFREPIDAAIAFAREVGIDRFLDLFFVTRNHFAYYCSREDRWQLEWIRSLRCSSYHYLRAIVCHVLGERRIAAAAEALEELVSDDGRLVEADDERAYLMQLANEALDKIRGRRTHGH